MKRLIFLFPVCFVAGCITSAENTARIKDPSLIPLERSEAEPGQAYGRFRFERFRLIADFNHDGVSDMFLSYNIRMFGNAGGGFTLYKGNADGTYTEAGGIFLHPLAVNLREDSKGRSIITLYIRGGQTGKLIEYEVLETGFRELWSRHLSPNIGGPERDQQEYRRLFGEDARVKAQVSRTVNGVVEWEKYP